MKHWPLSTALTSLVFVTAACSSITRGGGDSAAGGDGSAPERRPDGASSAESGAGDDADAASTAGGAGAGDAGGTPNATGGADGGTTGGSGGVSATGGANATGGEQGAGGAQGTGGADGAVDPAVSRDQLLLWFMADRGVTDVDGAVSTWSNQSLNGGDAWQSINGARPRLVSEEGMRRVEFDGMNDYLVLPEGFADFSAGLSFFAVVEAHEEQGCPSVLHLSNAPEEDDIVVGRYQESILYEVSNDFDVGVAEAFELGSPVLLTVVHSPPDEIELRINGQLMAAVRFELPVVRTRVNNFIGRSLFLGCEYFDGDVRELMLYDRGVDRDERDAIEAYLQNKWQCCR